MKRNVMSLLLIVVLLILSAKPVGAVPFMINPYTPDWVNPPFYWLDCQLGGYVWGKC